MERNKFTVESFIESKQNNRKISMLTAYDFTTAKLLDEAGIDTILVGDSLGMVMLGYENTLQVTMEDMLHHTRAVCRGVQNAFVIGDMPFLSYHTTARDAVLNAGRFIQEAGAQAVKLERGSEVLDQVKAIIDAQIPVLGHLGLTPQSVNVMGGFKVQGRSQEQAEQLIEEALLLQDAGVFALVLECVPEKLAEIVTSRLTIPTIGIGAGRFCDGQVLVIQDMLGMYREFSPKFVKKFAEMGDGIIDAVQSYQRAVQEVSFPEETHSFKIADDIISKLY